ncbi:MAG: response regulator, partial [Pseudobdellovibrionaceae bacterium]|nr:response regulator [Pseudobdellovibrionaceae bacterium]
DIQMPVLDGYCATKELRRRGFRMPIVALTAHAMREQREQSVKAGFSGYITKPVNRDLLIKTVILLAGERHH